MKKLLCIIGIIFATTMSTTAFAEMFSFPYNFNIKLSPINLILNAYKR